MLLARRMQVVQNACCHKDGSRFWLGSLFKELYAHGPFFTRRLTTTPPPPYHMPEHFRSFSSGTQTPPRIQIGISLLSPRFSKVVVVSGFFRVPDPLPDLGKDLVFCSTIGRNLQLVQASFPVKPFQPFRGSRFLTQVPKQRSPFPLNPKTLNCRKAL